MLVASRELSLSRYLLKHLEHTWVSFFDIVNRSSVVRVNPGVSVRVEVYDKFQLLFVVLDELFESLSLFFREC